MNGLIWRLCSVDFGKRRRRLIGRVLRDERGVAAADVILVIAAVSIPLVIALVAFGDDIVEYLEKQVRNLS